MLDSDGFRANVAMIVCNRLGKLLWTKRIGNDGWQFPQGGMQPGESPEQAMYRELREEVGLCAADVSVLGESQGWLRYRLPKRLIRRSLGPACIGQKQKWFLLGLESEDSRIRLDLATTPEFDDWRWVDYWAPSDQVVEFKRQVYRRALTQFRDARDRYVERHRQQSRPVPQPGAPTPD